MRGTLSIDLLVTSIVILMLTSTIISFVYFEEERILEAGYELGAQALAISIGSAINQFIAISPDSGNLSIYVKDISNDPATISMAGIPFSNVIVTSKYCNYTISNGNVNVTIKLEFAGTGRTKIVSASYPIFAKGLYRSGDCGSTIIIDASEVIQ